MDEPVSRVFDLWDFNVNQRHELLAPVEVPIAKITGTLSTKITWNGGKGTTNVTEKFTAQKTIGKCPKGTKYLTLVTGTTAASTGAAAKIIKSGEPISGSICTVAASSTKYVSSLLKGTQFKL